MTPVETDSGACSPTGKAVESSTWRWAKRVFAICILAVSIGAALFSEHFLSTVSNGWPHIIVREVAAACRDPVPLQSKCPFLGREPRYFS